MGFSDLPPELIEQIILASDPLEVAALSQTSRSFYDFLYGAPDQHIWRELYLAQPLDDPRTCIDDLGFPIADFDWKGELQRVIRARTVVNFVDKCRAHERCEVLQTLLHLITQILPSPSVLGDQLSKNLLWVAALIRGGTIFDHTTWVPSPEEQQLRAKLHTYYGLTPSDAKSINKIGSRAFVYNMRNYKWDNEFGPFAMDGSGRVNWLHVRALHHCMSLHLVDMSEDEEFVFTIFPMSLPYCQTILPAGLDLSTVQDWAGIQGEWVVSFCFCDHRELLVYNNFNLSDDDPLDTGVFANPEFVEVFRSIIVHMRILSTEPNPAHPSRPRIYFAGEIEAGASHVMNGWVAITDEGVIRWHFVSGEEGHPIWSSEGIQVGGVRSPYGVLGSWTTVFHDAHDPIGPFWMRKVFKDEP
ncbi:hypothetical protein NEOLEDRAFT_1182915 [Neolentinus lepideus HHB14362 ss-1]|uniref:F-box domain-containing protein n=1 Tax=Neolentinus lepideus HHB14362 ss-1 TaxID=1314782 RepID=A0A165NR33_9AGAM|nr:hypothetical protein NEOLEDRAFT_1182915 [Neolentinus lepideus HHB14362 ss-1]